ncbi:uncharacterized protein si:dkey-171c9.3 isoform X3 [Ctenopharyngodon idella]|uniref:uncharacterized protein si:dkey-171c9.3 isoform X3 n=1 Tax=Ctenopharyngodon idella TaxID=7959 RepID=UPI00223047E5|nr:uncharacterized protein si:dkey-171c9.3 isoform X3 [Ctenopharyngodon idella]
MLAKGAIEVVPPALTESGFYSRYFLVSKKDGGLRPILDLRHLNRALIKRSFRMIILKQIFLQIRPGDWIFTLDLKDAYFHIQIARHHRQLLRFAFEGIAYQYTVLPFGLSLAPCTFTKCMDAALSPLRQMGVRILNYLDDWLVLAQSEAEIISHRSIILNHLECLGLRVNFTKSLLQPTCVVPGDNFRLNPIEGHSLSRAFSGHPAARTNLCARGFSAAQNVSGDARSDEFSISGSAAGLASHEPSAALAETTGPAPSLATWSLLAQGEPGVCHNLGPLDEPLLVQAGRGNWGNRQEEGRLHRYLQDRLGSSVRQPSGLWCLERPGKQAAYQLPVNDGGIPSSPGFPSSPGRTPRPGQIRQHDGGILHKSS